MSGIIGKKLGMTSIFGNEGEVIPVTVIEAGPCTVVDIKTTEKDGYQALQLGFGSVKEKKVNKPLAGHFKKNNLSPKRVLKEFRNFNISEFKIGDEIKCSIFNEGDIIKVTGKSKGKGFQGVVKRHGFGGIGMTTHGQSDRVRAPGSIGASSYPSRVFKGQRMAGRMGYDNVTIRGLKVVKVDPERNLIFVRGAVPGAINSIVELIKN
ncbi:Ribosomal protein L3 [Ignavibacterium album JCM 16511]|uniref:Large ribosomal subunit protein uL3 n=1 Tax=Ignavibacterium album (strain DSM 19864 / JCM 16511 / NBRC 101810 / Mat9-16) TaxID=945713 RepID=I0AI17_IGNAJ|nr:50S ribosomal protein L3 [Ignavibacterium album]AFH48624.1 Ribosomal protein L3 [Ignavibacterium album JCM 16511]